LTENFLELFGAISFFDIFVGKISRKCREKTFLQGFLAKFFKI